MDLIWNNVPIREDSEQTIAIRQAKHKDPSGFFLEMNRLRTQELKAWTDALKTDRELLELRARVAGQEARIASLEEELAGYRIKPGQKDEAEERVLDMMEELQREYELDRSRRLSRSGSTGR